MVKGCSNSLIQIVLFVFNFFFVVLGASVFGLGVYIIQKTSGWKELLDSPTIPGAFIAIVGGFVFLVAFFGCFGAIKESQCLLKTYCFIVAFLAIAQIGLAVYCIMYKSSLDDKFTKQVQKIFEGYDKDDNKKTENTVVDFIQSVFQCCGVKKGHSFWNYKMGDQLPESCCRQPDLTHPSPKPLTCKVSEMDSKRGPCDDEVKRQLNALINWILGITIIAAFIQFVAACMACVLANAV